MRETEAIIGKAPRLGIHTRLWKCAYFREVRHANSALRGMWVGKLGKCFYKNADRQGNYDMTPRIVSWA